MSVLLLLRGAAGFTVNQYDEQYTILNEKELNIYLFNRRHTVVSGIDEAVLYFSV